jgi:hypothetical protein
MTEDGASSVVGRAAGGIGVEIAIGIGSSRPDVESIVERVDAGNGTKLLGIAEDGGIAGWMKGEMGLMMGLDVGSVSWPNGSPVVECEGEDISDAKFEAEAQTRLESDDKDRADKEEREESEESEDRDESEEREEREEREESCDDNDDGSEGREGMGWVEDFIEGAILLDWFDVKEDLVELRRSDERLGVREGRVEFPVEFKESEGRTEKD